MAPAADGRVMVVDHDPARLAGRASERWQLSAGGQLTVAPGDHALPAGPPGPASGAVVVIEVDGLDRNRPGRPVSCPGCSGAARQRSGWRPGSRTTCCAPCCRGTGCTFARSVPSFPALGFPVARARRRGGTAMIALLRYQAAILLRSHRWIFPLIAYGLLVAVGGEGSTPLAEGLGWSAAMLVPVVALLTRSMLTAEPDAARAVVAAAAACPSAAGRAGDRPGLRGHPGAGGCRLRGPRQRVRGGAPRRRGARQGNGAHGGSRGPRGGPGHRPRLPAGRLGRRARCATRRCCATPRPR